jgi:hypothetical protein
MFWPGGQQNCRLLAFPFWETGETPSQKALTLKPRVDLIFEELGISYKYGSPCANTGSLTVITIRSMTDEKYPWHLKISILKHLD